MSDQLYLGMAVVGTFLVVVLARVAWVATSKQRQPTQGPPAEVHRAGLPMARQASARFSERVVAPISSGLANLAARLTPAGARDKIAAKLVMAGSPEGWTAERVLALKGLGMIMG